MNRVVFWSVFSILTLGLVGEIRAGNPASKSSKLHVLFIAVDDLGSWASCLGGHPQARTPNIDRLAGRGVLFTRAYCAAPACNPSRVSLLTGRRPSTTGVYHNSQPFRAATPLAVTLPECFRANGYRAVGMGKIYHGRFPDPQSWDEYTKRPADPVPPDRPVNGIEDARHFDWGPLDVDDAAMSDARIVDGAIRFLEAEHEQPFFLAVGLYRPHLPWYVPRHYFDAHPVDSVALPATKADDLEDVPGAGQLLARRRDHIRVTSTKNWEKAVAGYLASIAFADAQVGRLLDALQASAFADNTIVVLWGDHGWHLGQKEHWRKFALWEEATRVPLIVLAPGVTEPEGRCKRTVSLLDLYPTLAELCGLEVNEHLEGRSLVPLLRDPSAEWNRPVLTTHGRGHHAVRSERWRYIRYADLSEELYDHESDPHEWHNVAGDARYVDVKTALRAYLPKRDAVDVPVVNREQLRRARLTKEELRQERLEREREQERRLRERKKKSSK